MKSMLEIPSPSRIVHENNFTRKSSDGVETYNTQRVTVGSGATVDITIPNHSIYQKSLYLNVMRTDMYAGIVRVRGTLAGLDRGFDTWPMLFEANFVAANACIITKLNVFGLNQIKISVTNSGAKSDIFIVQSILTEEGLNA